MKFHNYFVYIITNKHKNVIYTGITNDIQRRIYEHENGLLPGFSKKHRFSYINKPYNLNFTLNLQVVDIQQQQQ